MYALLAPLIVPISVVSFGCICICFRYTLLYESKVEVDTGGRLYFEAIFHLFWGIFTSEICFLGLFILKTDLKTLGHDLGQIIVICFTLFCTVQYYAFLKRLYRPLIRDLDGEWSIVTHPIGGSEEQESYPLEVREKFRALRRGSQDLRRLQAIDGIIWLPKDSIGVSNALVDMIRASLGSRGFNESCVTNSGALMTDRGQVVLQSDVTSFIDSLEHERALRSNK